MSLPPNTRGTRSRYNSPFPPAPTTSASESPRINTESERPRTHSDIWVEPSLAPARPSFAEAGIERHGVVANMAALGSLPTAKVMKAATTALDMAGRGAAGKKTTPLASTPGDSNATADATPEPPTVPSRPSSSQGKAEESTPAPVQTSTSVPMSVIAPVPEPVAVPAPLPATSVSGPPPLPAPLAITTTPTLVPAHTSMVAPQTPQQQMSPRRYVPQTTIMQQKMGQSVFALARPIHTYPQPAPPAAPQSVYPPRYLPPCDQLNRDYTDKVVESAVQEAIDQRRWPTAYALRTLYDDQRKNDRMVRLIDAVYTETADANQIQEFKNVMKHKKKEGKRDRTGELFFYNDGNDPVAPTNSSAGNAPASAYSTPSGLSGSGARTMSDAQARRSSFILSSASASPHKEYEHHVSKKHKGNNFTSSNLEMNGNASAENGVKVKTPHKHAHSDQNGTSNPAGHRRAGSLSSSSSLSSVDEQVLDGGEDASTTDSGAIQQDSTNDTAGPVDGIDDVAAPSQARNRPTPYANAKNSASAETHPDSGARNQHAPITAATGKGPKTYTFSTVTTTLSPVAAHSSSTHNNVHAASANYRQNSSANSSMAPAALLPSATLSPTPYLPSTSIVFKTKKDLNKASARSSQGDDDSMTGRMKREARKLTEKNTSTAESFERRGGRHQASLPLLPEPEYASDGVDSAVPTATGPKRALTKIRLLSGNRKTTRQTATNDDSDSLSSPTALSFANEIAPGSLSASRAGTPNTSNRPTRKGRTGTGLRVKTS